MCVVVQSLWFFQHFQRRSEKQSEQLVAQRERIMEPHRITTPRPPLDAGSRRCPPGNACPELGAVRPPRAPHVRARCVWKATRLATLLSTVVHLEHPESVAVSSWSPQTPTSSALIGSSTVYGGSSSSSGPMMPTTVNLRWMDLLALEVEH